MKVNGVGAGLYLTAVRKSTRGLKNMVGCDRSLATRGLKFCYQCDKGELTRGLKKWCEYDSGIDVRNKLGVDFEKLVC